jgi:putative tryptophan/tyrosine transport system substrate-binding protein
MRRRKFITLFGGAVAAWPLLARGQRGMPVVGLIGAGSAEGYAEMVAAFRVGLGETGFIERQNVLIEYRWADDQFDRLPALAAELVRRKVDVIVSASATANALAAKAATTTIPIVFALGSDPVQSGVVTNLSRPDANITGVAAFSEILVTKRLELAREFVPEDRSIAVLLNPNSPNTERRKKDVQDAAQGLGRQVSIVYASGKEQFDAVFAALAGKRVGALIVMDDTVFTNGGNQLASLAARYAVPIIFQWRQFSVAGGLMSYGPDLNHNYRLVGTYTGRILKGEHPADLPIIRPSKFELVINLKTARALGVALPPALLARADEVIE